MNIALSSWAKLLLALLLGVGLAAGVLGTAGAQAASASASTTATINALSEAPAGTITTAAGEKTVIEAERISYRQGLTIVRAFYLDLSQWAVEDPGRWAQWVAPCPVSQEEISLHKFARRRKSRRNRW